MTDDIIATLNKYIEQAEARVADLESKIGGADDMYIADKINYHLGRVSGLRYALAAVSYHECYNYSGGPLL